MKVAKIRFLTGAVALSALMAGFAVSSALADTLCANCQLQARNEAQMAVSLAGLQEQARMMLAISQPLAPMPSAPAAVPSTAPLISRPKVNWDIGQELPGSFHPKPGEYNPTFSTPFWSMEEGFINAPSAPWNQYVPSNYGAYIFALGMRRIGPVNNAPFAPPVWN